MDAKEKLLNDHQHLRPERALGKGLSPGDCRGAPAAACRPAPANSENFPNSPPLPAPLPAPNAAPLLAALPSPRILQRSPRPALPGAAGRTRGSRQQQPMSPAARSPMAETAPPEARRRARGSSPGGGGREGGTPRPQRRRAPARRGGRKEGREGGEGCPPPPGAVPSTLQAGNLPTGRGSPCLILRSEPAFLRGGAERRGHLARPACAVAGTGEEIWQGAGEGRSGGSVLTSPLTSLKLTPAVHKELQKSVDFSP